jgi:ribonuclease HII
VILPPRVRLPGLDDSKRLSQAQRERLRPRIGSAALAWCVALATVEEVDDLNILRASFLAMHRAIDGLAIAPEHLLIDGNRFSAHARIAHTCLIQGDGRYRSIAAASVLAKTHRDEWMMNAHAMHPHYAWDRNMGYGTAEHRRAIREHGPTPLHRRSFTLLKEEALLF